jgi:hypothetical protein
MTKLDNIDTRRLMDYVVKCNTKLNQEFAFQHATPTVVKQLNDKINKMILDVKEFEGVTLKEIKVVNNEIKVTFDMPLRFCEGYSAKQLRDMNVVISDTIPDCAVIKNGMFEFVKAEFVIGETI